MGGGRFQWEPVGVVMGATACQAVQLTREISLKTLVFRYGEVFVVSPKKPDLPDREGTAWSGAPFDNLEEAGCPRTGALGHICPARAAREWSGHARLPVAARRRNAA